MEVGKGSIETKSNPNSKFGLGMIGFILTTYILFKLVFGV